MTTHYPCDRCNMDEGSPICLRDGRCPAMADWWHLKGYGYAPGNYMNKCHRCDQVVTDVDKRAVTCRPCAEAMHAASTQAPIATDRDSVRRELMALARREVITDRDRLLIGAAIGLIGKA